MSVNCEVCFLVGLGEKMVPGSVVGCVENIVNTEVFVRFHFFTYLVNRLISNRLLGVFLVAFWVPWADFFRFLRVWGAGLKIQDFSGIPWRDPGLRESSQAVVKGLSVGLVLQTTYYRLQA